MSAASSSGFDSILAPAARPRSGRPGGNARLHGEAVARSPRWGAAGSPGALSRVLKEFGAPGALEGPEAPADEEQRFAEHAEPQGAAAGSSAAASDTPPLRRTLEQAAVNKGSAGHPELCARPCLFFPSGKCAYGDVCDFCHMPHDSKVARLDKRQRELLQELPVERVRELMFPLLHQKMQVYTSEQCWRHFVALCGLCGVPAEPVDPPPSTCRAERALVKVLRNLSLRHLLLLFQRSALRRELEVNAAVEALVEQLLGASFQRQDVQ